MEVANVVVNGSQSKVYEREADFKSVPVSVDAGFTIGTHSDEERNPTNRFPTMVEIMETEKSTE